MGDTSPGSSTGELVLLDPGPAFFSWVLDGDEREKEVFTLRAEREAEGQPGHEGDGSGGQVPFLREGDLTVTVTSAETSEEEDGDDDDGDSPKTCLFCGLELATATLAVQHMLGEHLENEGPVCSLCGARLSHGHSLRKHVKAVHFRLDQFECPHCRKTIQQRSHLNRHIQSIHTGKALLSGNEDVFQCSSCDQKFFARESRDRHSREAHGGLDSSPGDWEKESQGRQHHKENEGPIATAAATGDNAEDEEPVGMEDAGWARQCMKPYQCGLCFKTVWSSMHLKAHLYQHTNEKLVGAGGGGATIRCDYCGVGYLSNEKLLSHVEETHAFQCPDCPRHFQTAGIMASHFTKAHLTKELACCTRCGQCFKSREALAKHVRDTHGALNGHSALGLGSASPLRETTRPMTASPSRTVPFSCTSPSMARVIASPTSKTPSGKVVVKDLVAAKCPSQVSISLPGKCTFCQSQATFRTSQEFDAHVQESHPFKCPLCNKMVKLVTSIRKHFRKYHEETRPHFCRSCTQVFCSEKRAASHRPCWKNRIRQPPEATSSPSTSQSSLLEVETFQSYNQLSWLLLSGDTIEEIIFGDAVPNANGEAKEENDSEDMSVDGVETEVSVTSHPLDGGGAPDGDGYSDGGNFHCKLCDDAFDSREEMLSHVSETHPFDCPVCERPYRGWSSVRKHCRLRHGQTVTVCKTCALVFTTPAKRDLHFTGVHGFRAKKRLQVSVVKDKRTMILPKRTKKDFIISGDVYHCLYCEKTYEVGTSCRKHSRKVHGKSQAICKFCPSVFKEIVTRDRHVEEFHQEVVKEVTKPYDIAVAQAGSPVQSQSLRADVAPGQSLLKTGKHPQPTKTLASPTPPSSADEASSPPLDLWCDICQVCLPSELKVKEHMEELHPFKCPDCQKRYKFAKGWRKHYREHHSKRKVLQICNQCCGCFTDATSFDRHQTASCGERRRKGLQDHDDQEEKMEEKRDVIVKEKEDEEGEFMGFTSDEVEMCQAGISSLKHLRGELERESFV